MNKPTKVVLFPLRLLVWVLLLAWGIWKWLVRVLLWLIPFTWPIGLWRSLSHSRRKDTKKIIKNVHKAA